MLPRIKHDPRHILAAQELAYWLETQQSVVGMPTKNKNVTSGNYAGKKGIVFVMNGWGPTDHIDVWNGFELKEGDFTYFSLG